MSYLAAKAAQAELQREVDAAAAQMRAIPGVGSGSMGLTPDHVRATPEFKAAWQRYSVAFSALRTFNGDYVKRYRSELRADRRARRGVPGGTGYGREPGKVFSNRGGQ